jgi:uncharacterized delta-60 repeat protein
MTLSRWFSTTHSPARPRSPRVRLNVERLEDRLTPTAGLLDPTFGAGAGYVLSSFSSNDAANAVAVQSNGQIVIAGATHAPAKGNTWVPAFLVARYNADGSLDTSFGSGGHTVTVFNTAYDTANAVAIQSDGKILVAGGGNFCVARYNTNGTLDTTFGNNGKVQTALGAIPYSIAVQSDGKIVVAGNSGGNDALVRYNANGTLDTTFGNGGELVTNIQTGGHDSLVIQSDGKIVLASGANAGGGEIVVARFNANGTADSSFGSGGEVFTQEAGSNGFRYSGVALQADGKIVASSILYPPIPNSSSNNPYLCLIRYNADGTLDTTFGPSGNGIDPVPGPAGFPLVSGFSSSAVEIQSDGKIIASADLLNSSETTGIIGALRVNSDGSVDTNYGNAGWATGPGGANASALQPDGRLLLAGSTNYEVELLRFTGDTTAASFSVSGFPSSVTAGTSGTFTVTALNPDGTVNTGYLGTVHFTSGDPNAVLPADYTFTAADQGVHTFSATLVTAGSQSLTATDTTNGTLLGGEAGIQVTPAAASQLVLSAPSSVSHRSQFSVTVTVEDAYGNVVTGYLGTIHFSSSDSSATLPADYTFTTADAGVHTFSNVFMLRTRGNQTLKATDTQNSSLTATDTITVT